MSQLSPAVIAYALQRNHPDIYQKLQNEIATTLPVRRIEDLAQLSTIVTDFCALILIEPPDWKDSRLKLTCTFQDGETRECRISELREILLAVVLMFYHPERIYQILPGQVRHGIVKELTKVLKVNKQRLSESASNAITYFKAYKAFYEEVQYLYRELNDQHQYFENHVN